jgi:hypothetical protein
MMLRRMSATDAPGAALDASSSPNAAQGGLRRASTSVKVTEWALSVRDDKAEAGQFPP